MITQAARKRAGRRRDNMSKEIWTVIPHDPHEMPQEFNTFESAREYGDEAYGEGNYGIVQGNWPGTAEGAKV